MLHIEKASNQLSEHEMAIMNSDTFFNRVSKNKESFTAQEILKEIQESDELGAERYLLKDGSEYIGVLEFLLRNPSDDYTWLGLVLIDKKHQSKGYGYKALQLFYDLMKDREVNCFRIGVIKENEPGLKFWQRNGFDFVKTTINSDNKEILVYQKEI